MQGIPVVPGLAGGRKFRDLRFVIPQKVVTDDGSVLRRRVRGLFERRKRGQNDDDNNNKLAGYNYGKSTSKHVDFWGGIMFSVTKLAFLEGNKEEQDLI